MAVSLLYREGYFSQVVDSLVGQIDQATSGRRKRPPACSSWTIPNIPDQPLTIRFRFYNVIRSPHTGKGTCMDEDGDQ